MRNYTIVDMLRFVKLSKQNPDIVGLELVKLYNEKYPELTAEQKLHNLGKAINKFNKGEQIKLTSKFRNQ